VRQRSSWVNDSTLHMVIIDCIVMTPETWSKLIHSIHWYKYGEHADKVYSTAMT
jgi:hypothetical protein